MKKKFKKCISLLILTFVILTSFTSYISAAILGPECYDLFNQITAEWKEKELHLVQKEHFEDYGFEFGYDYRDDDQPVIRSKTNHLVVFLINDPSLVGKVKPGDIVISVGDIDTSKVEDENIYKSFSELKDKKIVKFLRNGKEFELELSKLDRFKQDETVWTSIHNISNVDIKNSTFTAKIDTSFINYYDSDTKNLELGKVILENLIYKNEEGEWAGTSCYNMSVEKINELKIPVPGEGVNILNTTSLNKNLISTFVGIHPWSERIGDDLQGLEEYAQIMTETVGTYKIQNNFKLQTFPFDKQTLKISLGLLGETINKYEISHNSETYSNMEYFVNNNEINGWDIIGYDLNNDIIQTGLKNFSSVANIEIYIERQHGYYIYKVLIPILLILMVCWSVVWVDPKELESRLTITIVCLLSLIAYNFVIDSELPKLEYLTVMDWIILVSYFYATIPNFISVISFRVYKTNRRLSDKIEGYSKKYGASSYLILILIIILINANLFPENSSAVISWMAGR